ncbi:hypothetical protein [Streptomyces sp. OE57]|uniref:hypothetical protein n=1 Tax=Streptomyces lacaronensis TaxID=3379885 RepID=UPI0039B74F67
MDTCPSCGIEQIDRILRQALPDEPVRGRRGPVREIRRCSSCRRLAVRDAGAHGPWADAGVDPSYDFLFDGESKPLPEPWLLAPTTTARALEAQLHVEVSEGHPLFGTQATAIARCGRCDEVLFSIEGDPPRFAQVHLTWRQAPEPRPWPWTEYLSPPLSDSLTDHSH